MKPLSAPTFLLVASQVVLGTGADLARPDVVVARQNGEYNTFFPTVERLRDGELLVVFYESPEHMHYLGRIALVRSRDDGRTWSAPTVVVDRPGINHRDPSIIESRHGTLIVSYYLYFDMRSLGVFVLRSEDKGKTWSAPIPVGTSFDVPPDQRHEPLEGPATSAKIVELDDGDLLIPAYGHRVGETEGRSVVLRSHDDGRTWPASTEIDIGHDRDVDFVEPALAYLGHGRVVAVMRTERARNRAYATESQDGGKTWTKAAETDVFAQASDLLRVDIPGQPAPIVVHTWGDWSGKFGEGRPTVMQVQTTPGGSALGPPRVIYHGHCTWGDESYPSTVRLDSGRLFTVFYDACAKYIGGRYTNLSDLF
ncbi:MAG: exo-alpha-sialidase [Acidobacteria bacterium]|nr:exo-alpha-sialidase [Acidobacteriota bacterium]